MTELLSRKGRLVKKVNKRMEELLLTEIKAWAQSLMAESMVPRETAREPVWLE